MGIALALSLVAVAASGAGAAVQLQQGLNGRIAFAAVTGIASMNPDGSGQWGVELVGGDTEPAWSPDGSRLAVSSYRGGDGDIYTMDPNGSRVTQLTFSYGEDTEPSWSPDGSKIAFTSSRDGWTHVFVMAADGSGQQSLTDGEVSDGAPAWSPDGTRIAFSRWTDGNADVYSMAVDGGDLRRLTTDAAMDWRPSWSPDGTRIAFESYRNGEADVYSMKADGKDARRLTTSEASDYDPAWSPDGRFIAFVSDRGGKPAPQIFVMDADGANVRQLTSGGKNTAPAWQPLPAGPSFCRLWGTPGNDLLVGGEGEDFMCGLGGNDTLIGLGGPDLLSGGDGRDWIAGGRGQDLLEGDAGVDRLDARDGQGDLVYGGGDGDLALVDPGRIDDVHAQTTVVRDRNIAVWRPVYAPSFEPTNPPVRAVDGRRDDWWNAGGFPPRWIQIDLGRPSQIAEIRLVAAQQGRGTVHRVLGRGPATGGELRLLRAFRGPTAAGDVLTARPARPWRGIRFLRIETATSGYAESWLAWPEIEVLAPR